jgi:hypothetical protein
VLTVGLLAFDWLFVHFDLRPRLWRGYAEGFLRDRFLDRSAVALRCHEM